MVDNVAGSIMIRPSCNIDESKFCFIFVDIPAEKHASSLWMFFFEHGRAPTFYLLDFAVAETRKRECIGSTTTKGVSVDPLNWDSFQFLDNAKGLQLV